MKKLRLCSILLILVILLGVTASAAPVSPYAIKVNRAWNTVTIYTADENGQYTVPYKAMICSTARPGHTTPLGSFRLAEYRSEWRLMLDGTYGQYATQFKGHYLFHSICYADDSHDAMKREAYNNLGNAASMGCVRLETADAKWIFDNCPAGTPVTVYDNYESPGPLGKPEKTVDYISEEAHNGWDPTDPAPGNPWKTIPVEEIELTPAELTMEAGEKATIEAVFQPENAMVLWRSNNEDVAKVDNRGNVTALSAGQAVITAAGLRGARAQCTVTVEGELLPFDDLTPGAWYYPEVRQALNRELFSGLGNRTFSPDGTMTRAMVVQVLYKMAGSSKIREEIGFTDVAEDAWYANAVAWACFKGVVKGVSQESFAPDRAMTRQELATVLWRYAGSPKTKGNLEVYSDAGQVASYAETALSWMTEKGILQSSNGQLQPARNITRAETAAILVRYKK